jgi:hypothetical protein
MFRFFLWFQVSSKEEGDATLLAARLDLPEPRIEWEAVLRFGARLIGAGSGFLPINP